MGASLPVIGAIATKNLQILMKDKRTIGLLIGMPIIVMLLFGYAFGQEVQNVPIQVVNLDKGGEGIPLMGISDTKYSDLALEYLNNDSRVSITYLDAEIFDLKTATQDVSGVKGTYALLILPNNFTENLPYQDRQIKITLYVDGSEAQPIAAVRSAVMEMINNLINAVSGGDVHLSLEIEYTAGSGDLRPFDSMAPGVLSIAILLFMILTVTGGFTKEKLTGTIDRVTVNGATKMEIILGYMFGNSLIALLQCTLLLIIARLVFDIMIAGSLFLLFLVLFVYALSCVGIGILASSFARTELQAFQFIPLLITPFLFFTGFMYPVSAFPKPFQILAALIPMTYSIRIVRSIMINGANFMEFIGDFFILVLMTLVFLILATISFKTKK
jgi:ABC-2 type transport system permease protein